jgi:D-3-phosphoglycerate dehydrogenase
VSKPVVLIAEELSPATVDALGPDFEIRNVDGTDRPALLAALAEANAILVRSATKVDAEVLAAATRLTVVARAGVGLDNVDVAAATARGVMVVNAPRSNIVSAAEHAVALLLSAARHIPAADASLRQGQWKRSAYTGVELSGKTVGIVGLGKIGQLVAQRLAAFGVELVAYDPYVAPALAAQLGIELLPLEELLRRSDAISIHLPKTAETLGLIGKDQLALTKPGVLVVNAARGGLVDEDALAEAVRSGHVGGAGIDVYLTEPAVRAAQRRRHPAPRRLDRRGAGPGRHRRRPLGAARARRRVRARRGERAGRRRGRRGGQALAAADAEAGRRVVRTRGSAAQLGHRRRRR